MAVDAKGPPPGGGGPDALGLGRERPERALLALRKGGWVTREQVAQAQRAFLLDAVAEAVGELGYAGTRVREVVARARVSNGTFYALFGGLEDCLLAALDRAHARVWQAAVVGHDSVPGDVWTGRARGAVTEVLALLDAQPLLARLCVLGAPTGPPSVLASQRAFADRLARGLALSARQDAPAVLVSRPLARALVAGASAMLAERLIDPQRREEPLLALAADVTRMLCAPFAALPADQELGSAARGPVRDWTSDGLAPTGIVGRQPGVAGTGGRLLALLEAAPGMSNAQLVQQLGVAPGTVSRRLAQLAKDGLIVNRPREGRHAWRLTEQGRDALASAAPV